jgi:acyl-CoA synthetase (NDP forming)
LIGASDDPTRITGRPLAWLRRHGFEGAVYSVNPNRDTVQGERAYSSVAELPEAVDHAYLLVKRERVGDAVQACGEAGIRLVTVLADGFAEAGDEGRKRQEELLAVAARANVRLLGPNSLGVVVPETGLALSANAALQEESLPAGRLMLLSQSGSMLGAFLSRGVARGIGFAALVSVGNEADLSIGEIGAASVGDPGVAAFLLFLETLRDREALAAFARAAHKAGKPVLAYKLGRSRAGQEAAQSHTGALLASDKAANAFFAAHGIARVEQIETLLEAPPLFIGHGPKKRSRTAAIVTTTGGGGSMVADRLGVAGIEVTALKDVTLAGTQYEVMSNTLGELLERPENEIVIAAAGSSARFQPELAVQPIIDRARESPKPLAAFTVPEAPDALRWLSDAGIAAFRTPESCADAMAAFLRWQAPDTLLDPVVPVLPDIAAAPTEADGYAVAEALGIPVAPYLVVEREPPASLPFAFPVAVKVHSARLAHKTEAGGVVLGVSDSKALNKAIAKVRKRTGAGPVLIQQMASGLGEVLVGFRDDPQAGPVVTVAPGGILAEIYGDAAVRLAPVDEERAREMIAEVKGLVPLRGYRDLPKGDIPALAQVIAAISRLALAPEIAELEINPLIVRAEGDGVIAVDALVRAAE